MNISKTVFKLVTAEQVDEEQLDRFMRGHFSKEKCDFLHKHGLWRHKSKKHRMIVLNDNNKIAGYCAAIPAEVWALDRTMPALFWVDNYVPPEMRGKRIQSMTDQAIRQMPELSLGFPNEFVIPIHRKHGWDVREDYNVMLMPLDPPKIVELQGISGKKELFLYLTAKLAAPAAWLWRIRLKCYKPVSAKKMGNPDPEHLAAIFRRYSDGLVTTNRDTEYINWRYMKSPFREQYSFFTGGSGWTPSLIVICRTFIRRGIKITRILDIFGDLGDKKGLSDILRLVASETIRQGASQVTAMATNESLKSILKSNGFILSVISRFRCYSKDPDLIKIIRESRCHWVLADSDNDTVD